MCVKDVAYTVGCGLIAMRNLALLAGHYLEHLSERAGARTSKMISTPPSAQRCSILNAHDDFLVRPAPTQGRCRNEGSAPPPTNVHCTAQAASYVSTEADSGRTGQCNTCSRVSSYQSRRPLPSASGSRTVVRGHVTPSSECPGGDVMAGSEVMPRPAEQFRQSTARPEHAMLLFIAYGRESDASPSVRKQRT